jgi:hypothetical protein
MRLPPVAQQVVDHYLGEADAEVPGLVEGLYFLGSVALGDFRPRSSDLDFVAVTAERPGGAAVEGLRRVHDRLRGRLPRPFFDGSYVTWADLARDPQRVTPSARSHEGRLGVPAPGRTESPVTWHMLAQSGVPRRGPAPAEVDIFLDRHQLTAWTVGNLGDYWERYWLRRSRSALSPLGLFAATPYSVVWVVTGVSRMHCTAITGKIISKEAAAEYALVTFAKRWHPLVKESLRIRRADSAGSAMASGFAAGLRECTGRTGERPLYRNPLRRRRDVLDFGEMVIADARQACDVS